MEERKTLLKRIAAALIVGGRMGRVNYSDISEVDALSPLQRRRKRVETVLGSSSSQYQDRPRCLYFCSNASGCLSRYEAQNGFPLAPDECIPVVATECLGECKNGPVAVLRRDSAEVMVAGFGAQDAVNKIRHFAMQAFDETDMPLDKIPFRHYPG